MPEISLTDFVDFVAKSGTPRLTHVRKIKGRGEYSPAEDFWRRLRKDVIEFHSSGQTNKGALDATLVALSDPKKRSNYAAVLKTYKLFLGNKKIQWFQPVSVKWNSGGLIVRINPELGLIFNGVRHHVKLYFKVEAITKAKADTILLLMEQNLPNKQPDDSFCILDVRRGKLFGSSSPDPIILPLLMGEASAFSTIWTNLP